MYHIIAHTKPSKDSEHYGHALGAYTSTFIDYAEIDGAYILAKHYIENESWEIIELENEYFIINSIDDVADENKQSYHEAIKYGFSIIFHIYEFDK